MGPQVDIFEGEPEDTREAIMQATYDALSKHGYADLTIQRIGDEFEKSKSLLYHHYDSKDALLVDFLDFMLKQVKAEVPHEHQPDAYRQLLFVFDYIFDDFLSPERNDFNRSMIELRAQAATNETFREQFTSSEAFIKTAFVEIISDGIEQGIFRDVDPERTAEILVTVMDGAAVRNVTVEDVDFAPVREELEAYVRLQLLDADVDS